jgi:hypothetical protein
MSTFYVLIPIALYIAFIGGLFYLIYSWVSKFIALRQEQNDLLREIIKKLDTNINLKDS